jgi:hypothetical protein
MVIQMENKETGEISYFDEREIRKAKKDKTIKLHIYKVSKTKHELIGNLIPTDTYTGVWE